MLFGAAWFLSRFPLLIDQNWPILSAQLPKSNEKKKIYLYYKVRCLSLCQHSNVQTLSSPPVLKIQDSQGLVPMVFLYPNGGNKANWSNIQSKTFFFIQVPYVIPNYCHSELLSFRIIVIPNYCHSELFSFRITVIPNYCYFELLSFRISQ